MKETGYAIIDRKNEIIRIVLTRKEADDVLSIRQDCSIKLIVIMDL